MERSSYVACSKNAGSSEAWEKDQGWTRVKGWLHLSNSRQHPHHPPSLSLVVAALEITGFFITTTRAGSHESSHSLILLVTKHKNKKLRVRNFESGEAEVPELCKRLVTSSPKGSSGTQLSTNPARATMLKLALALQMALQLKTAQETGLFIFSKRKN